MPTFDIDTQQFVPDDLPPRVLHGGATGTWTDNASLASSDIFGNIYMPDGTVIDASGTVFTPPDTNAPAGTPPTVTPAITQVTDAVGSTVSDAAASVGSSITSFFGSIASGGKWIVAGLIAIAVIEIGSHIPERRK